MNSTTAKFDIEVEIDRRDCSYPMRAGAAASVTRLLELSTCILNERRFAKIVADILRGQIVLPHLGGVDDGAIQPLSALIDSEWMRACILRRDFKVDLRVGEEGKF